MLKKLLFISFLFSTSLFAEIITLSDEGSYYTITQRPGVVVVDFYASWCGPCNRMHPIIAELAQQFPSVTFLKVDIDRFKSLARNLSVLSLPTFIVFKNGARVSFRAGFLSKSDFTKLLRSI